MAACVHDASRATGGGSGLRRHGLQDSGLEPGLEGKVTHSGDEEVAIEGDGGRLSVTRSVAETVSVTADPSPPPRTALPEQLVMAREHWGR